MKSSVSERYARALFLVTKQKHNTDSVRATLDGLVKAIGHSSELKQVLSHPRFKEQRLTVVLEILKKMAAQSDVLSFVQLLEQNGRLQDLPDIYAAFVAKIEAEKGILCGEVLSASVLAPADKEALSTLYTRLLGQQVQFKFNVDSTLLGGLLVKVRDNVWDGSVRAQLQSMKTAFLRW